MGIAESPTATLTEAAGQPETFYPPAPPRERIASVDALRGFDMIWIVGASEVVHALQQIGRGRGVLGFLERELTHSQWQGCTFYDLIFPLFVFLVGLSIVLSLPRVVEREGRRAARLRVLRRFVLLFVLGIIVNGGLSARWPEVRLMGVLQRIALCYLFTSLLFLQLRPCGLFGAFAVLMIGYWALLTFVPAPGQLAASFAPGKNLANWVDWRFLPGLRYYAAWDPEGILSTAPAVASCLLGVFAGMVLTNVGATRRVAQGEPPARPYPAQRVRVLIIGGAAMVAAGYLWGLQFPVVKEIWTSSFVLVAGGYSSALLGLLYYVVDVKGHRSWAQPFVWVGANAITIYLIAEVVPFGGIAQRFVGGSVEQVLGRYGEMMIAAVSLGLVIALAWFMYRRRVFLRL